MKETGILIDKPKREKPKTVHTPENIAAVTESVCETKSTSIHRHSQQLNISEISIIEPTAWPAEAGIWMKLFSIINRKDCTFKYKKEIWENIQ